MNAVESNAMTRSLEPADAALLAAYLLAAVLGTWNFCLLVNDGAVFLSAAWLGDAWDLYFGQFAGRAAALLASFGPIWALRNVLDLSSQAFLVAGHALYFAVPLLLWGALRAIEPHRLFSRLYLAIALAQVYFPGELVLGCGLWLLFMAMASDARRSTRQLALSAPILALLMAFTHPALALMSLLYLLMGGLLVLLGRSLPRRSLAAAWGLALFLLAAYAATSRWLPPTNATVIAALAVNRFDFVNPLWMLATLWLFPMLAALWLLLLAPGLEAARARWRLPPPAQIVVAFFGLWFAAAGTGLLTWVYIRHTAGHVLAVSLALALAAPTAWLAASARPLLLFAAVMAVSAISYNADLFLFGRFVDRHLGPGIVDVDQPAADWPPRLAGSYGERSYLKWGAGPDYQRDVVVPIYDWYQVTLAFYSFFRSDRQAILFHPLGHKGDWYPFECGPVERALHRPHDEADRHFLTFLDERYCVR